MSDRPSGAAPSRLVAVLGPTNTGKTHLAVERMLGHASGMIGLPLRLLAREIYDRIVKLRGARSVALITGEEKIVPPRAVYFVCTVEAMPLNREVEFLAVDEIQLCADPTRGHIFTHRLLHARGKYETMFMGAAAMAPLIRRLLPDAEFMTRERFSRLAYEGSKKLTRLPPRSAVVAFSADAVYAIAELIRRQRGGAAVVMGSLSPRTRNAQVALYQSGEVDFLVATDAIGMGLNMDVDHVAFAGLRKFDGKRTRWLAPPEVGQIAGRAGRYRKDGTFGVTGETPEMDEDLVAAVEEHSYEPLPSAEWRSCALDFTSLKGLVRSLAAPPAKDGLKLAEEALDETTLKQLAGDPDIEHAVRDRQKLRRLWEVAQTPDFRKTTLDEHVLLTRHLFEFLTTKDRRIAEDWVQGQFAALDHLGGEIDVLAQRLAGVRTLAYVANRPDWLRDPGHWQHKTRHLEDRLSDTLHEKLMARFVDRRTSVLMRALRVRDDMLAGVAEDGVVTVEGQVVGKLTGIGFEAAQGASALEDKALRAAAQHAVAPELSRRLGQLAADADGRFSLAADGSILWGGGAAGRLVPGGSAFKPRVRLLGELGDETVRERARRRLEAFVAAESARRIAPLKRLRDALGDGGLRGLARGVAYQLSESGGLIDRAAVAADVAALSPAERRSLRQLGVRFGAFSLFLPALLTPEARAHLAAFAVVEAPHWRPAPDAVTPLPSPPPPPRTLAAHGLRAVDGLAVPVQSLEALDAVLRAAPREQGGAALDAERLAPLGWPVETAARVLRGLGYAPLRKPTADGATVWRRRGPKAAAERPQAPARPDSPFAALVALQARPEAAPKRRKRRRGRTSAKARGAA
jgi:ATP-dependent RNA helicase SUPV3L1/SUV3